MVQRTDKRAPKCPRCTKPLLNVTPLKRHKGDDSWVGVPCRCVMFASEAQQVITQMGHRA